MIIPIRSILIAGLALAPAAAQAGSWSATMSVSAEVTNSCVISTTAIASRSLNTRASIPVDGDGSVQITCSRGSGWSAAAELGSSASFAGREMISGPDKLSYGLYTDPARTSLERTGAAGTATVATTGSGLSQIFPVYGRTAAGQASIPVASRADLIVITITY